MPLPLDSELSGAPANAVMPGQKYFLPFWQKTIARKLRRIYVNLYAIYNMYRCLTAMTAMRRHVR